MTDKIETKGKTVKEAVSEALLQMGARQDEVEVTILEEPKPGFLGFLGSRQARVLVQKKTGRRRTSRGRDHRSQDDNRAHDLGGERSGGSRGRRGGRGRGKPDQRQDGAGNRSQEKKSDGKTESRPAARTDSRRDGDGDSRREQRSGTRRGSRGGRGRGQGDRRQEAREQKPAGQPQDRQDVSASEGGSPEQEQRSSRRRRGGRGGRNRRPRRNEEVRTTESTSPGNEQEKQPMTQDAAKNSDRGARGERTGRDGRGGGRGRGGRSDGESRQEGRSGDGRDRQGPDHGRGDSPERRSAPAANVAPDEIIVTDIKGTTYAKPLRDVAETDVNTALNELTNGMLVRAGFPCRCEVTEGEYSQVKVVTDDSSAGMLIGRHGATVDAVEHLVERMASTAAGGRVRMNLDINNYRRRREETLMDRVDEAVARVRETGRAYHMEPMCARERRIVHLEAEQAEGLRTFTMSNGSGKHVVIAIDDGTDDSTPEPEIIENGVENESDVEVEIYTEPESHHPVGPESEPDVDIVAEADVYAAPALAGAEPESEVEAESGADAEADIEARADGDTDNDADGDEPRKPDQPEA